MDNLREYLRKASREPGRTGMPKALLGRCADAIGRRDAEIEKLRRELDGVRAQLVDAGLDDARSRALLCFNAYQLYRSTLHVCEVDARRQLAERLRSPVPGDLVMEISTIGYRDRDDVRLGRLLRDCYEPCHTRKAWVEDYGGGELEAIPEERIVYVALPDGRVFRWYNADFIVVLETPFPDR